MVAKKEKKDNKKGIYKIVVIAVFLITVGFVLNIAPNYIVEKSDKVGIIINNNNVTKSLKNDIYVENDVVYISTKDIANFFDDSIYYDNKYNQIITCSDTKVATLQIDKKEMYINSSKVSIKESATKKDNNFYLPFSEMEKVYNVEIKYYKDSKTVTIDSLDRKQEKANSSKDCDVKYLPTLFSKTVDKVKKGNSLIVVSNKDNNGWIKVRTENGILGYVKEIANIRTVRDNMEIAKQIDGKVSMVWDYYSEYVSAPTRTGKIEGLNVVSPSFAVLKKLGQGDIVTNIGTQGKAYIEWAHSNEYKVWPMISNNSMKETTSEILNDYELREKLINNIVNMVVEYNIDGINIDFENIYQKDKDVFSRFIIELAPRLKEYSKVLSVDVTAPDGGEDWSMCYDRNEIAKAADYIVFMAYDQYGASSTKAGTTSGLNWVETNVKKFLGQEGVTSDKIILGIPFYTKLWKEVNGDVNGSTVSMKSIDSTIPQTVERQWQEDLKQNYVEYQLNGATYKMWIEDEDSIKARISLLKQYNLAGAAYWAKDRETQNIWNVIAEELK